MTLETSSASLWLVGTLLAILSYIGRDMISKMELIRKDINDLDKNLAIITEKIKSYDTKIGSLEEEIKCINHRIEKIEKVRFINQ